MHILAIPGSLRFSSSSFIILLAAGTMLPPDIEFKIYKDLFTIPPFDDSEVIPPAVEKFRELIKNADGVFICTPEYAFGVPGVLKNALDWTVGSGDLDRKPVALITASSQGEKGHASLLLTLTALSADIIEGGTLLIPFVRSKITEDGRITDAVTIQSIQNVMDALTEAIMRQ